MIAAFGLLGPISQLFPLDDSVKTVVLLIGMAVGVDYALFYVVRSREERLRGASTREALERTSRTSGRSVLIAGTTVAIAMAGQFVVGSDIFNGIAAGTIVVVACAVAGSVTVLPALLQLLGPRIDRGRIRVPAATGDRRRVALLVGAGRPGSAPAGAGRVPVGRAARRARGPGARDAGGEAELGCALLGESVRSRGADHGRVPEHVLAGDRGRDAGRRASAAPYVKRSARLETLASKPRSRAPTVQRSGSVNDGTRLSWGCR